MKQSIRHMVHADDWEKIRWCEFWRKDRAKFVRTACGITLPVARVCSVLFEVDCTRCHKIHIAQSEYYSVRRK